MTRAQRGESICMVAVWSTRRRTARSRGDWTWTGDRRSGAGLRRHLRPSNGTVTFSLKNAKSGCYTTDVTDVTADEPTWDGATPANESCK